MSKVIGIDLGTTNSVVSVMEGGEPTVITNLRAAASRRLSSVSRKMVSALSVSWQNVRLYRIRTARFRPSNVIWAIRTTK